MVRLRAVVWIAIAPVWAQSDPPPSAYSAIIVSSMSGPYVTRRIFRDGMKSVVDTTTDRSFGPSRPGGSHSRSYFDLDTHKMSTIDLNYPSTLPAGLTVASASDCRAGSFHENEWGDIFERSNGFMKEFNQHEPKQIGTELLNGFHTRILAAASGGAATRVWLDIQYGLVVKVESQGRTQMEVKRLTLVKPRSQQLAPPPYCTSAP